MFLFKRPFGGEQEVKCFSDVFRLVIFHLLLVSFVVSIGLFWFVSCCCCVVAIGDLFVVLISWSASFYGSFCGSGWKHF